MIEPLLLAQNITSVALSLVCWFLAHQEALREPPGRIAATGYAMAGLTVLLTMFARNWQFTDPTIEWLIVATKMGLILSGCAVVWRQCRNKRDLRPGVRAD